jgi:hypothetical protein
LASAAFASAADVVARYRHPVRSAGNRIVLLHDSLEDFKGDLTPYDAHIVHLEKVLGRQSGNTAHLARGAIFGHREEGRGWYLCGLGINLQPQAGIDDIDRHELAHVVIDLRCGIQAHPPTVLVEGWAESQSGYAPGYLAKRAWKRRIDLGRMSLRAMTSDNWYAAAGGQCYEFGGALVDYILRTHGGPKFFELYSTCQPETFEQNVAKTLGVTLEELDRDYWDDIEKQIDQLPIDLESTLTQLPLAEGIDPNEWKAFAAEFARAIDHPVIDPNPTIVEYEFSSSKNDGAPILELSEIIHAGDRHRWLYRTQGKEHLYFATPDAPCEFTKAAGSKAWSLAEWKSGGRRPADYWNNLAWMDAVEWPRNGGADDHLTRLFSEGISKSNSKQFRITQFERDANEPAKGTKLGFEFDFVGAGPTGGVAAKFTLLPMRRWAISEYQVERHSPDNTTVQTAVFEYPADDPQSARPKQINYRISGPRANSTSESKLIRHEPWKVDESAFDPAALGISQVTIDRYYAPPWYVWLWGVLAPVSLLSGIALLVSSKRQHPAESGAAKTHLAAKPESPPNS